MEEVLFLQACLYRDTRRLCTGFLFKMYSSSILLLGLLCPAIQAGSYTNLPPVSYTVEDLRIATDPRHNYNGVYHDGGGGASQNGYHVQVYADSSTTSEGFNFVHNSVAYYGYASAFDSAHNLRMLIERQARAK